MKLWVDKTHPAPEGYTWCKSAHEIKIYICQHSGLDKVIQIEEINFGHDAGEICTEILKWLEQKQYGAGWDPRNITFKTHSWREG